MYCLIHHTTPVYIHATLTFDRVGKTWSPHCLCSNHLFYLFTGTELLHNELDCPLLILTKDLVCVTPTSLVRSISIVHQSSSTCVFKERVTSTLVERETIESCRIVYGMYACLYVSLALIRNRSEVVHNLHTDMVQE